MNQKMDMVIAEMSGDKNQTSNNLKRRKNTEDQISVSKSK
jgi:hypothetical protein